jgi:hypothetical protein
MAGIIGTFTVAALYGSNNSAISTDLNGYIESGYAPLWTDAVPLPGAVYTGQRIATGNSVAISGMATHSFTDDLYNRVYVSPRAIELGSMVAGQQREVAVWNAFIESTVTLTATDLVDGEGLGLDVPVALPAALLPLQERIWTITVLDDGPPSTQALLNFTFTGLDGVSVAITGTRLNAWMLPADWGLSIDESLNWLTDFQQPLRGGSTRIPLRAAPRRTWEFSIVGDKRERRIIENLLYDWTSKSWALPVWTDMSRLSVPLIAGDNVVPVVTSGLDFNVGSVVMLWADATRYELQEVAEVGSGHLLLARGAASDWPIGTRLYPCRRARLTDAPSITRKSSQVITMRVRFEADEPCDWPAVAPSTTYLGIPVFEQRPETSNDPTSSYVRDVVVIDGDVGLVAVDDFSGLVTGRQTHAWKLYGRDQKTAHRSLLYWLQGRAQNIWLPTWQDDLELAEPMTETGTVMAVNWCGVTRSLRLQPGRRHIRIELTSGQVFHREVQGTTEISAEVERLQIDAALGVAILPGQVRMICWMALSTLSSDRVEITHVGGLDGLARSRTTFASDGGNEP